MTELFPFVFKLPVGIELSIGIGFTFLGILLILCMLKRMTKLHCILAFLHVSAGLMAVAANDLLSLLLAWELLTFSAFALIWSAKDKKRKASAFQYLGLQIVSAVCFFTAAVLQYQAVMTFAITTLVPEAQLFMAFAVLIKAACVPFHFWLVQAYPAVPLFVTPLLSVFASKVAVLTGSRLLSVSFEGIPVLAYAAALSAVISVIFALKQHNARRLLCYHVVSQLGYMLTGVGLAGFHPLAVTAGLFHLLTHTLYKSLLFLVAASVTILEGHEDLPHMKAKVKEKPLLFICGLIGAFAISGVPFTSGYVSKELLMTAAYNFPGLQILLSLASVGTALSFTKFIYLLFLNPRGQQQESIKESKVSERGRALSIVPALLLAIITIFIGIAPKLVPGVPPHAYYTSGALMKSFLVFAAAVLLWLLFKKKLCQREHNKPILLGAERDFTTSHIETVRTALMRSTLYGKISSAFEKLHNGNPQTQILTALIFLLLTAAMIFTL